MVERLPWHESVWQQLQTRRVAARLPHALLLVGRPGLGKLDFARRWAAALLCKAPEANGDACGRCRTCHLFQVGSHPDYALLQPAEEGKVLKVDQIRQLSEFLSLTAQYGGYKVALLAPADALNLNAANSLLKTLEEPPDNTLLVLVTAHPARVPATVRSRCQWLRFEPPTAEVALPWLASRCPTGIEPQALLALADGAPLAALAAAEPQSWSRRQQLFESYQRILAGSADPIRVAEGWLQGDLTENLRWLVGWHIDLIRLKMVDKPPHLANPDLHPVLQHWASRLTGRALFERCDAAIRLARLCSTTQANPQLLLEVFFGAGVTAHS